MGKGKDKAHFLSGSGNLKIKDNGLVKVRGDDYFKKLSPDELKKLASKNSGTYAGATAQAIQSQRKLNDHLKETGYSLKGGPGMQMVGTYRLNMGQDYESGMMNDWRGTAPRMVEGGGHQVVNLYGQAPKAKASPAPSSHGGSSSSGGGGGSSSALSPSEATPQAERIQQSGMFDVQAKPAYNFAQEFISSRFGSGGSSSSSSEGSSSSSSESQRRPGAYGAERDHGLGRLSDGTPEQQQPSAALQKTKQDWSASLAAAVAGNRSSSDDDDDEQRFAGSSAFRSALSGVFS